MLCSTKFIALCALINICHIGVQCVDLSKWGLTTHHHSNTIEEAIKRYFEGKTNVLHVRVHTISPIPWKRVVMHHLTNVLRNSTQLTYRLNIENKALRSNKRNSHNLWYVDSYVALSQILPFKKEHFDDGINFYIIFLIQPTSVPHKAEVRRIMQKMFQLLLVDVIVIVKGTASNFIIYSFELFQENRCRQVKPIVVNHFKNGRFEKAELFPPKLTNFHNCTLRAISRNVSPFLKYEYVRTPSGIEVKTTGIESNMLQLIAETLKFRVDFHIDPKHRWGDIYRNGTIKGPFVLLENGVVDFLAGYFFCAPHRMPYFEESTPYLRTPMVAVVKHVPARENLIWMLEPFKLNTWLTLCCLIVVGTLSIYLSRYALSSLQPHNTGSFHKGNWLDAIGTLLGEPRRISTSNTALRCAIAVWCAGFVIFNAAYQAKLYNSYNQNEPTRVPKLVDLIEQNYTFLQRQTFNMDTWSSGFVIPQEHVLRFHSLNSDSLFEELLNFQGKASIVTSLKRAAYYIRSQHLHGKLEVVHNVFQMADSCMYFRHHSYLVSPFNKVIAMIRSCGLINKWLDDTSYTLNLREQAKPNMSKLVNHPKPLSAKKFTVVFTAFVILQMFAGIVLVVEMCVFSLKLKWF